ncbi:PAS domain-containing protein [Duganella callida]|uniref:PAS domain S-box protein n=1 Tax=Duganella callida TaxID=2561932 RepID=A0A4Y9S7F5_9BURK|nr:PAS domain-containing protein [Duganella callida]TFW17436.1 PAS domain S-box protein [Duganella callida]
MTNLSDAVAPAAAMQRAIAVLAAIDRTHGLAEFSPDGRLLDANQNFLDLMGYSMAQLAGRDHRQLCCPDYALSASHGELWRALARGQSDTGEYLRVTSAGRRVWLQGSYNPVFDDAGRVVKVIQLARDVTGHKLRETGPAVAAAPDVMAVACATLAVFPVNAGAPECKAEGPLLL